ncbi:hypothetical protein [Neobacillus terrae]|uniref:hypothetical protein n=1 Tax=Neobacillus terrae TaxID=3034837 RepID=UPI001408A4B2|nr:hypothetical protein [Neobacillus terrae]NHM31162.1 hypothetical protein [Neobacillus terrae]
MTKKTQYSLICIGIILLAVSAYIFFIKEPLDFPNKKVLNKKLEEVFQENGGIKIKQIQFLDKQHAVVFFSSRDNANGTSFWKWDTVKWSIVSADTMGIPKVWKVNPSDENSYYVIWNFGPGNQYKKVDFYLISKRNFLVSDEMDTYTPGVQLKTNLPIEQYSSGVMKLPMNMTAYIRDEIKIKQMNKLSFFNEEMPMYQFGWLGFANNGKIGIFNNSDGSGFGTGGEEGLQDVFFRDPSELEGPLEEK